ncbi:tetratricopeptide repeat protein [Pseudodesulfovibrio sp. JC047]|uniref:tetratricopeptide repeat protein n=1 Tax=Pseudodesulfovibrio sp. JC047 TaxID=2683199 RepID=UPI0013CF8421|nr:tetratricopeptide repeat protein [Pseudodesulfovibrio sp. JC047]NDV20689.1 tetratricopeptide repeat protein [Pseudodesulfovibrio sp. JC047]
MSEYPEVLGVYSLKIDAELGAGRTSSSHDNVTYWYARQLSKHEFEVQPLNAQHVPSGVRSQMQEVDFLSQYRPEMDYYRLHTVPALETLLKKIRMGEQAFFNGDLDEAERQFIKALMIDDKSVDANYGLGAVYSEQKDFDKLKKVLDTLLSLEEAFSEKHRFKFNQFGISLRKNGHYDESIRYYNKALEIVESDEHLYFNLARVFFEKKHIRQCISSLETALSFNPEFTEAKQFLSYCKKWQEDA